MSTKQLNVEVRESKKLTTKKALFISFPFNMETVKKIKSLPKRYYNPQTQEWEVPARNLNDVVSMFQDYKINLKGNAVTKVQKEKVEKVAKFERPDISGFEFKTKPFDHQLEGFRYATSNNKFILGDEQGLGKTKQAIDIAVSRKKQFKHTLIVCGVNSLKWNWFKEVGIHSNEQAHILGVRPKKRGTGYKEGGVKERLQDLKEGREEFFLITNIETLRNKDVQKELEKLTREGVIGMTIIDEIHKCKNASSTQGKAIHKLKSYYKMALTGTPLMNSPIDLYNILKWIDVEKRAMYKFKKQYCIMGGFGGYEIVGYRNLEELKNTLQENMLRRKKDEVLNLPPKIRQTEYVEMLPKQSQLYREVRQGIMANLDEILLSPNPLAELIRLRQVTGCPSSISDTVTESAKVDRLLEMVEELTSNGKKAVIFSNWTDVTNNILPLLKQYNPSVITGDTKDRQGEVEKFQNDDSCKVIVGTIGAMGTGLTLTAASTVIFMDKPWNPANRDQAEDRAHRIGTNGTVNVVTLVAKDTIDERIEQIIYEKGDIADAMVDNDPSKLEKIKVKGMVEELLS